MNKDTKEAPLDISGMHYGAKRQLFDNARKLRENMTESEKLLWQHLRRRPLGFKFRRQHPIHVYILDFYCHKKRLPIEIDGGYHANENQREKDLVRTSYLKKIGINEIRFSNDQIFNQLKEVKLAIRSELLRANEMLKLIIILDKEY